MEYSLARSLETNSEILFSSSTFPRLISDPALDFVNPGLGQMVNLYDTFVPLRGSSIHTIEKKVETSDEIQKNLNEQLKTENNQAGFGESKLEPEVMKSLLNPIVTDSIVFPEVTKKASKRKEVLNPPKSPSTKKLKFDHKFQHI